MAAVGVLSSQLVLHFFVARRPEADAPAMIRTIVDRLSTPVPVS